MELKCQLHAARGACGVASDPIFDALGTVLEPAGAGQVLLDDFFPVPDLEANVAAILLLPFLGPAPRPCDTIRWFWFCAGSFGPSFRHWHN